MATADALKRGRRATMLVFLLVGAVWGSWAPHVALVKQRLDLSPGILGLVLLSAAAGAMVSGFYVWILNCLTCTFYRTLYSTLFIEPTL